MSLREIDWASGLFEGEGSFSLNGTQPCARLYSTDRDVVERFVTAIGLSRTIQFTPPRQTHHKPQWGVIYSGYEQVQFVTALLWRGLGQRRRSRAVDVLTVAMQADRVRSGPKFNGRLMHATV